MHYCEFARSLPVGNHHRTYHDTRYGFPLDDDRDLFGRLILEINQAGLSWDTILKKEANFQKAFNHYDPETIAEYTENDIQRLLLDPGIIRNRKKIEAVIRNAGKVLELQKSHGSFRQWLQAMHPLSREEWTNLFRKTFFFTGGEIVNEFLMSTGLLPGAHLPDCPVHAASRVAGALHFSASGSNGLTHLMQVPEVRKQGLTEA